MVLRTIITKFGLLIDNYNQMLKYSPVLFLIMLYVKGFTQVVLPTYPQAAFPTYYWQKSTHFETLQEKQKSVLFIGDSLTDGAEWSTLFSDTYALNFGISGEISAGVINRLPEIVRRRPAKVFLMIGINDLARNISVDSLLANIKSIVGYIKQNSSTTKVFVQNLLPVNDDFKAFLGHTNKGDSILKFNAKLSIEAQKSTFLMVDLHSSFCDQSGKLKKEFTNDGLHLKGAGYALWKHLIHPYVYELGSEPAIIPMPKQMVKSTGLFPLYQVKYIYYNTDSLLNEAESLRQILSAAGIVVKLAKGKIDHAAPFISLAIDKTKPKTNDLEAYSLRVSTQEIIISSPGKAGVYYGVQTLAQLARDGYYVSAVDIQDSPAFKWRGYMVDVGRNYQSVALLKQQIDKMAFYKLNVFHLHLTEDIAWRLEIKRYPELTQPEFMERNKGMFYTVSEIKDLINYCKIRHILLVPEIDMPGHSAAFRKAMKTDMQSDSGLVIVKNILQEISNTYDFPYIHIGADEVKITNKNFIPVVSTFLKSLNKKVIGWEPGGNFAESTIRQLWMDDAAIKANKIKIQYIDSRHLYINHMDPLESVVTIFNRQLAGVDAGNQKALVATLCLWPDRAVSAQADLIVMNGVYPAMLAFAERSWVGKGYKEWIANVDLNGQQALDDFKAFEKRLMDHKKVFFTKLPFPYLKQNELKWQLYGPYENNANLSQKFEPELENSDLVSKASQTVLGGTIILRHWWAPKIKSVLKDPKENTTWYATRKVWSDEDTVKEFWIGFNNFSRSQAVDTPPAGQWDSHQSQIWVNGELVQPPNWLHAGQKGNLEIPLMDEGYEYREPTLVKLNKGWNKILIKVPIGKFAGKNWNNPEKWMFTCVELE
ncbi:hypothetical protein MASR2M52_00240 [Pedobacter sp.]